MNKELTEGDGWVGAEDAVPEEMETVLVATAWGGVGLGALYEGGWEVEVAPWDSPPDGARSR